MRGAVGLLAILLSAAAVGMPAPAGRQVLRAERSDISAPLTLLTAAMFNSDLPLPTPVPSAPLMKKK